MALLYYTFAQWHKKWKTAAADIDIDEAYPGILLCDLCEMSLVTRKIFTILVSTFFLLACMGNVASLCVNQKRKLRPFFRACLLSLACSDLASCVFSTTSYMAQFTADFLQLWNLGSFMCKFVPFVTTTTMLVSSLTLVAIALDRYMAIKRAVLDFWNPTLLVSGLYMTAIWLISMACSASLFSIYNMKTYYVLELVESMNSTDLEQSDDSDEIYVSDVRLVHLCVSENHDVGLYYVILFGLIFLPCIVAFVWLNAIIARQLWLRRHQHQHRHHSLATSHRTNEPRIIHLLQLDKTEGSNGTLVLPCHMMTAFGVAVPLGVGCTASRTPPFLSPAAAAREARHRRMVIVVLIMMAVFIILRLPAWIFLIMRIFGSFSKPVDWMLYYCFGVLNLMSCAVNPLFYTFLTETLHYMSKLKQKLLFIFCCRCCSGLKPDEDMPAEQMNAKEPYGCCGVLQVTWRCGSEERQQLELPRAAEDVTSDAGLQQREQFSDYKGQGIYTINSQQDELASSN